MATAIIDDRVLADIANAIRAKTGDLGKILPKDMATKISEIKSNDLEVKSTDLFLSYGGELENSVFEISNDLLCVYNGNLPKNDQPTYTNRVSTNPITIDWETNKQVSNSTTESYRYLNQSVIYCKKKRIEYPAEYHQQLKYGLSNIWLRTTPMLHESTLVLPIFDDGLYTSFAVSNAERIAEIENTEHIIRLSAVNRMFSVFTMLKHLNLPKLQSFGNAINCQLSNTFYTLQSLNLGSLKYMYAHIAQGLRICHTVRLDSLTEFRNANVYFLRDLGVYSIQQGRPSTTPFCDVYLPSLKTTHPASLSGMNAIHKNIIRVITDENNENVRTWGMAKNADGSFITIINMDKTKKFNQATLNWEGV